MGKRKTDVGGAKRRSAVEAVSSLKQIDCAACLGVSVRTLQTWTEQGCPRGENGYSLPDVVDWLRRRLAAAHDDLLEQRRALEVERLQRQVTILNQQIAEYTNTYMPRAEHERVLTRMGRALHDFIVVCVTKNAHHFIELKNISEANERLMDFWKQCMNAVAAARGGRNEKTEISQVA